MPQQTPMENDSVFHAAAGTLGFLLSVVRCGEQLSDDEENAVRNVIERLRIAEVRAKNL